MGSLFFQALEEARKTHKESDVAPNELYPMHNKDIPKFLAEITLCVKFSELQIKTGLKALREFSTEKTSMYDLKIYLPVFADFFGYIY
jgi:hypothetical protein